MEQVFEPWAGIPARPNRHTKARILLCHGRVNVEVVNADYVSAKVRGFGETYRVTWTSDGLWACSCPSYKDCSHMEALRLIVDRSELGRHRSAA